jgi:nicotinate dehydrogenase subunit A
MAKLALQVNGGRRSVESGDPDVPLLYVLRNDLALTGTHFGCGLAQCGACTVLVDGRTVRSCTTPARAVAGREVVTIESLGTPDRPDPLQAAFIAEQAAQCGYCTNGMALAATELLARNPKPTLEQVKTGLAGNLCRCGTHTRILSAVLRDHCKHHGVAYGLLSNKEELRATVRSYVEPSETEAVIPLRTGWRGEFVGRLPERLLTGKAAVRIALGGSKVRLTIE